MLIARVIADAAGLAEKVEAVVAELAKTGIAATGALIESDLAEFRTDHADVAAMRGAIDAVMGQTDALITDHEPGVPGVFVSDMDSTMIGQECIDELADFAGIKPQIAEITERAMQGELDFAQALVERVGLLKGLSADAIDQCLDERIRPMPGAKVLVETLKAKGSRTVLVTGGFHQFADPVARGLGFQRVVGNRLAVENGALTGGLAGPICDSNTKKATLLEELAALGEGATSLATGDGANDIPMIEVSSYGIAFMAKPKARAAANGWVDRGDLTAVLRLLGVPQGDWYQG
ncbi:phosphoserine phosphatase SerB [Novosphingobium sp. FSY-8]|uniref:Phosphoserine phosphatase n=1 Tax=Novosphingobium ovatum TaxID=1908523 RepID=A0ABW9XCS8_9SPHN|nr:phosphoserine phosphatase SerB [Novosphingobium ovatum]NBC36357.1 phosphoserine phosphatase SerB [Novosphingobium ovatum]